MKLTWLLGLCTVPCLLFLPIEFMFPSSHSRFESSRFLLLFGSVIYGFLRVATFHPLFRPAYHEWLISTNWSIRQPLPFGPIGFRPMDAIFVVPMLIGWVVESGPLRPLLFAVTGYIVALLMMLEQSSNKRAVRAVLFLSGFGLLASIHELTAAIALVPLLAVALYSHRRVLARLPHIQPIHNLTKNARGTTVRIGKQSELDSRRTGYPFEQTSPTIRNSLYRVFDSRVSESLIRATLFGWLMFCVCYRLGFGHGHSVWLQEHRLTIAVLGAMIPVILGTFRLLCYVYLHRSPLGPISRLRSGQLIIPQYDIVVVAPLATFALALFVGLLTARIGLHPSFVIGLMAAVSLFCTLSLPPGYKEWHFTGGHRLDRRFGV